MQFQARRCQNPGCGLRFPVDAGSSLGDVCPFCNTETLAVDASYETFEARVTAASERKSGPRLQALLDNVRSLNNVGAIFRSADGVGLDHLYLSGFSPTPAHPKLAKTSLGAETRVPWSTHADAVELASRLRDQGARLWALEGGPLSSPFYDALHDLPQDNAPLVLILGHEVSGVDPHLLRLCDRVVRLPMHGLKGSLNVAVAFGVAAYTLAYAGHLCGNVPLEITGR